MSKLCHMYRLNQFLIDPPFLLFLYGTLYLQLPHLHLQLLLSSPLSLLRCINSLCLFIYFVFVYCSPFYFWWSPCTSIHLLFGVPISWLYREKKNHLVTPDTTRNYASASLVPRCRHSYARTSPATGGSGNETMHAEKPPASHTRKVRSRNQAASCPAPFLDWGYHPTIGWVWWTSCGQCFLLLWGWRWQQGLSW